MRNTLIYLSVWMALTQNTFASFESLYGTQVSQVDQRSRPFHDVLFDLFVRAVSENDIRIGSLDFRDSNNVFINMSDSIDNSFTDLMHYFGNQGEILQIDDTENYTKVATFIYSLNGTPKPYKCDIVAKVDLLANTNRKRTTLTVNSCTQHLLESLNVIASTLKNANRAAGKDIWIERSAISNNNQTVIAE